MWLELFAIRISLFAFPSFQSHYGAIRTRAWRRGGAEIPPFQSHYGAIRTYEQSIWNYEFFKFQSHYGAIRTSIREDRWIDLLSFNPTMVRLERSSPRLSSPWMTRFNPTMVRLERYYRIAKLDGVCCFNPTMVRLERSRKGNTSSTSTSFQSHYGAIRTAALVFWLLLGRRFQSHYGAIRTWRRWIIRSASM